MKPKNYTVRSIKLLTDLTKNHPQCTLGQHISLAFGEFNSLDCMSDMSFYETLMDYTDSLEMQVYCEAPEDIDITNDLYGIDPEEDY